jgi:hypothetical protein
VQVGHQARSPGPARAAIRREQFPRHEHEHEAGQRVDRHRHHQQQVAAERRRPPPEGLGPDDRQEVQVSGHQVEPVLGVVHGLVFQHEVHQRGQVRDGDHRRVQRYGGWRPGQARHHSRPEKPLDAGMQRVAGSVQEQGDGPAEDEQRRRHHDQQQMLDHVDAEQHVVVDADAALRRDGDDGQAQQEGRGPASRPGPGRVPPPGYPHAAEVGRRQQRQRHADQRRELPGGERVRYGQRGHAGSGEVMAAALPAVAAVMPAGQPACRRM